MRKEQGDKLSNKYLSQYAIASFKKKKGKKRKKKVKLMQCNHES